MFEKIATYIEENIQLAIDLQNLLTSIPALAPESNGDGEMAKAKALSNWLNEHGLTEQSWYNAKDERVSCSERPNLVVTLNATTAKKMPTIWIMSHLDVVPAGDEKLWQTEPFCVVQKDGKLFGRGTEDDQQGIVCSILALLALANTKVERPYTIKLLFVADEEVGSTYGIQYLLNNYNLFEKDDIIITPDGGDEKGETIEIAEKNLLWLKVHTSGKQAHGSTPNEGINAHLANCALALRLNALETFFDKRDELFNPNYSTFAPTKKEANVPNINTIPGEDVFYMDCRILPCYPLATVRKEMRRIMDEVEKEYGVKISTSEEQAVESPATKADCDAVKLLSSAILRVLKCEPKLIGIGGGTVGAYLRQKDLQVVVWSKQDETMHQPNEYCTVQNLIDEAKVLASVMLANN